MSEFDQKLMLKINNIIKKWEEQRLKDNAIMKTWEAARACGIDYCINDLRRIINEQNQQQVCT